VTLLSLVLALCPCLVSAAPVEDDCCESAGTSMAGVCCEDGGPGSTLPAPTVFVAAADFAVALPAAVAFPQPVSAHLSLIPTRPVVARAVLRI